MPGLKAAPRYAPILGYPRVGVNRRIPLVRLRMTGMWFGRSSQNRPATALRPAAVFGFNGCQVRMVPLQAIAAGSLRDAGLRRWENPNESVSEACVTFRTGLDEPRAGAGDARSLVSIR